MTELFAYGGLVVEYAPEHYTGIQGKLVDFGPTRYCSACKMFTYCRTVYAVAFTPEENGRRLISGSHDLSCIVWETDTGVALQRMHALHRSYVLGISVRHDALQFATASGDRTIGVWRALAPTRWDRVSRCNNIG